MTAESTIPSDQMAQLVSDLETVAPEHAATVQVVRRVVARASSSGAAPQTVRALLPEALAPGLARPLHVVRQVRLVRSAGSPPFLTLPVDVAIGLTETIPVRPMPVPSTYDIPAGSIWFSSALVAAAAPSGSYTGLLVSGGTVRFSQPIVISAVEVVVPAAVTVELDLTLAEAPPTSAAGPGADARAAQAVVPASVRLTVEASGASLETTQTARLSAYGFATELAPVPGSVRYVPELRLLAVPFEARSGPFGVTQAESTVFQPSGTAPIVDAAWGLPVEVIDPAQLGQAEGAGALLLWLDPGLQATWLGQADAVEMGPSVLSVDSAQLSLGAAQAQGEHVQQNPQPATGGHDRIGLAWDLSFPLSFFSEAAGSEALLTTANLSAVLSKPIDLGGEQLPIRSASALVAFIATDAGRFVLMEGTLEPPSGAKVVAFALQNAVLRAGYPTAFLLYGSYDGVTIDVGKFVLTYVLFGIIPTLPDPYAASYSSLRSFLDQAGQRLLSIYSWQGGASTFDFLLTQSPQIAAGTAPVGLLAASEPSALFSRGSENQWPIAIKALGEALAFEREHGLILLDVSTNVGQFGVALQTLAEGQGNLGIHAMSLQVGGSRLVLVTLPAVQWEAVETLADPDPTFPPRLGFANSGVPTLVGVPTVNLVPTYPAAALKQIVENFAAQTPAPAPARFTLPFGLVAWAELRPSEPGAPRGATVSFNRPTQGTLQGAHQLRIDAVDPSLAPGESPSLPGYTVQLPVGQPGFRSVLGNSVTTTFNTYLGAGGARPLIPVVRLDLSGYGESLFSDWRNPYNQPQDTVGVVQARFDVLIGRTAYEVIQIRSILLPYGVRVVRTVTIQRLNNAVVTRRDSGWQAVSDGIYDLPSVPAIETHPGVVRRITNVSHIRESGQVVTVGGIDLAAVYFDGDLELDGAPQLVAVKDHFGFVQITAGTLIDPATYADLINTAGALGGPVDTSINVAGGPQVMRVQRTDVGITSGMAGPEFVMTAWGSLSFPGGGQWSVLHVDFPDAAPKAVPKDRGLPLIRNGPAPAPPPLTSPYRFADPADLATPDNPASDYGIVHATGTQRAFFPRPKIEATDTGRITSTQIPSVADPYSLATALDLFPELNRTIPFPSANWALRVDATGQYRLEMPSTTFPAGVGRRTMRQAGSVTSDLDYTAAQVTYELDTAQPVPWRFRLDHAAKVMNSSSLGDVIRLDSNVVAAAGTPTIFDQPQLQMGGALSVVQDLLTILADLGITGVMNAEMTNALSLKVGLNIPFVDATGKWFQIPPIVPEPDIKFEETQATVEITVAPDADEAGFELGGKPMFAIKAIPGLYAVAIIQFSIKLSTTEGTTYSLLLGVGFAYDLDAGPFGFKGLIALTFFGFIGDTTIGFGIGFLLQLELEIVPIIRIEISLEGKLALVWGCKGTPDETEFSAAKLTFGVEVSICLVFSISFEVETTASSVIRGPGAPACALPDVL